MNRTFSLARRIAVPRRYITLGGHKPNLSNVPKTDNYIDDLPELMTSAPKWDEKDATESEASVKADHEPIHNVQELKNRSIDWLKKQEKTKSNSVEMDVE